MLKEILTEHRPDRPIRLDNRTCVYCGTAIDRSTRTQEHVIGRRFVPKGTLGGSWNLIVWCCLRCNRIKADLEDDVSAITMQPDIETDTADGALLEEAKRKARGSFSRRTKKLVQDSHEHITIKGPFFGGEITFSLFGQPQVSQERAMTLAEYHLRAFFYFLTFNSTARIGRFWKGAFLPVMDASTGDWGNPLQMAFMNTVGDWEPRFLAISAGGFFKAVIRDHPSMPGHCSWALEWNQRYRIVGFFGAESFINTMLTTLPSLKTTTIQETPTSYVRYRMETPLRGEDDRLFRWPPAEITTLGQVDQQRHSPGA